MTSATQSVETEFVVGLRDVAAPHPETVGTKVATLARLAAGGFLVPDGFVVTTAGCERIAAAHDVPAEVWREVASHLERLGAGALAVRSSSVAEDLADASYAGQYDTVLGVDGPAGVAHAIRRCVASATSPHVLAYRGSDARVPMAVLVQRMVAADAAGVAFTANPITGDTEVLVSAVKGLGDRLVSGEATPDEWIVRGGEVSCVRDSEGALDANRAGEIARLAKGVEDLFGPPQDVEWAIAGGRVFLLQARPITALPLPPLLEPPAEGFWQKDTSHFPTPLTPFGASVYIPMLSEAMRPLVEEFGLMIDRVEQRSFGGEVYVRAVPIGGRDRLAPPPWAMWLAARVAPPIRRRARAARRAIATGLPEQILDGWEGEWRAAFVGEFHELHGVDLASLDDEALLGHLGRAKDMLRRGTDLHFRLVAPYDLALYELGAMCKELLGWDDTRALSLVTGSSRTSSEPGRALAALAGRLADDPTARAAVTAADGDPRGRLGQSAPWAAEALDEYLERYGHRTLNYDPGATTLFERPDVLVQLLAEQVRRGPDDRRGAAGEPDGLVDARARLAGRSEEERSRFERVLSHARRAYAQREDNVFWLDGQPCALLRYAAVEIGSRLADRGVLAHAGDAVFLEESELRTALSGGVTEDLRALVARRKAERAWVTAHPGPASYGNDPGPPPDAAALSALPPALRMVNVAVIQALQLMVGPTEPQVCSDGLRGVPGSPGRCTGPVRVVRDETEFAKLGAGDVLVAPVTSPPWSVLFLEAGAVVTDGGGVLSHTAVIAREYGIPAVLATGDASRRLRDGDVVTVDGTNGVVSITPGGTALADPGSAPVGRADGAPGDVAANHHPPAP
jgi:rifampicin phosphotransferase